MFHSAGNNTQPNTAATVERVEYQECVRSSFKTRTRKKIYKCQYDMATGHTHHLNYNVCPVR